MKPSMIILALMGALFIACGEFLPVSDPSSGEVEEVGAPPGSKVEGGLGGDGSAITQEGGDVTLDASSSSSSSSGGSGGVADTGCTVLTHSNGVGHTYKSCEPLGTFGVNAVGAACKAHMDGPPFISGTCTRNPPGCPCPNPADCVSWTMLGYSYGGQNLVVWDFAGPAKGHVVASADGRCPTTSDPTWN